MNVEILFKIAAVGILITVICQILKKSEREDIATLVGIAGLIIVFTMVITMIAEFFENIKALFNFY